MEVLFVCNSMDDATVIYYTNCSPKRTRRRTKDSYGDFCCCNMSPRAPYALQFRQASIRLPSNELSSALINFEPSFLFVACEQDNLVGLLRETSAPSRKPDQVKIQSNETARKSC